LAKTHVDDLIRQYFSLTAELENLFPKRSFMPDAHVIESFCEILAAERFDLELLPASSKIHNARTRDRAKMVQIKATQAEAVIFRTDQVPEHLLVMKLSDEGVPELVYNGPGILAYEKPGKQPSNGHRTVRLNTLRKIHVAQQEELQSESQ
jgi:hypothetical protein